MGSGGMGGRSDPQLEGKYREVVKENKRMMNLLKDKRKFDIYIL